MKYLNLFWNVKNWLLSGRINFILVTFMMSSWVVNGYSQKAFEMAKKLIVEKSDSINILKKENLSLRTQLKIQIDELSKNKSVANDEIVKLKSRIQQLLKNSVAVVDYEKEITILKEDLVTIRNDYKKLQNENSIIKEYYSEANIQIDGLNFTIDSLNTEIGKIKSENTLYERKLESALERVGYGEIWVEAKEASNISYSYEEKILKYNLFSVNCEIGLGIGYSGAGTKFLLKFGRKQGLAAHVGAGYLPNLFESHGYYAQGGLDLFLTKDLVLSGSIHQSIKHLSGFDYKNIYSAEIKKYTLLDSESHNSIILALSAVYVHGPQTRKYYPFVDVGFNIRI